MLITSIAPIIISIKLFLKNISSIKKAIAFFIMFLISLIPIGSLIGLYIYCTNCGSGCCGGMMMFPPLALAITLTILYTIIMLHFNSTNKVKELITKMQLEKKDNKNEETQ